MFTRTRKANQAEGRPVRPVHGPIPGWYQPLRPHLQRQAHLVGHRMQHWAKDTSGKTACFTARCGTCGGTVKVAAGRAPTRDTSTGRDVPSIVRGGKITSCPGKPRR